MDDRELDALLTRAATVTDNDIAEWTRDATYDQLCEEIMSTTTTTDKMQRHDAPTTVPFRNERPARQPRRWIRLVAATAAAAVLLVGVATIIDVPGGEEGTGTAWAAELIEFAEGSPLILLDDPVWVVTYADEYSDGGEVVFASGQQEAELHWRPGPLSEWLDDRLQSGTDRGSHGVVNGTATIVQYDGSAEYTALWEADGRVLEFRAQAPTLHDFAHLLDSIVVVDVDSWLTAMPTSVIEAANQPAAVTDMLTGIPLPEDFDRTILTDDTGIKDRYQLGARVVGAVSCAWIEQWLRATETGDTVAAAQAIDAMDTSSEWPILQEMNESGAYGQVLQTMVDAMHNDGLVPPNGPALADSYRPGLGCSQ